MRIHFYSDKHTHTHALHTRFLKAKVTILQQELTLSHQENAKNLDNLAKAIELQKKTEAQRCHANNTINTLNAQLQRAQQNDMCNATKLKVCVRLFLNQIQKKNKFLLVKICVIFFAGV